MYAQRRREGPTGAEVHQYMRAGVFVVLSVLIRRKVTKKRMGGVFSLSEVQYHLLFDQP